jgi:hypothetical protein
MSDLCRQIGQFLDETDGDALPQPLREHAAVCDLCRERLAIDHAIKTQLGDGVPLAPAHRERLTNLILCATPAQGGRRRRGTWIVAMGAAAAMAAAVLIFVSLTHKPVKPVEPTRPTALFADFFGPLADMTPKDEAPAAASNEQPDPTPIDSALAFLVGDWEGPLALGRTMIDAPTQVGAGEKPVRKPESN